MRRVIAAFVLVLACVANASAQITPVGPSLNLPAAGCYSINNDSFVCRSIAGTFTFGTTKNGTDGVLTTGAITAGGNVNVTGAIIATASNTLTTTSGFFKGNVGGGQNINLNTDGQFRTTNNAQTFGTQINNGTAAPTATTCGTGSVSAHSSNTQGELVATGATTCTLTFGAGAWTNTPFCVFTEETTAGAFRISASSTAAITITGFTSGDSFTYICLGGI